jgi:phospholipase C
MDGFVTSAAATSSPSSDGHFVMGYFTPTEIPFYFWLANQYPVADAFHCSALSGTWSNRDYLLLGSSYGVEDTGQIVTGLLGATTVFDELDAAKITWGVYTDDPLGPFEDALAQDGWVGLHAGVYTNTQFMSDLTSGKLPSVSFVDSKANVEDEHPPADVQVGEAWTKSMYDAVTASPIWLDSGGKGVALFFTYDESGGFYDHVVPPAACLASPDQSQFDTLGFRVPMILVSPFARANYVSHLVHQHTSILRFIELLFDLPALTGRDANSDALLDMFDTGCPAAKLPSGEPAAGTGGCP